MNDEDVASTAWDAESDADFYRAFEDRFRGAREEIKARLSVYRPFLSAVRRAGSGGALDLGCGRGEWLELLRECGLVGRGIDRDPAMLEQARADHLDVAEGDLIAAIEAADDDSLALATAFHVVEHLPFPSVRRLVRAAHRALSPGGLLILETPNPENFQVATFDFFHDPTHRRPLTPQLLEFLARYCGFARVRMVRLQRNAPSLDPARASLNDVLTAVAADVAIIAQKEAPTEVMAQYDAAFACEDGVGRAQMIERFDRWLNDQARALDLYARTLVEEVATKNANLLAKEAEIQRLTRLVAVLEKQAWDAEARAAEAERKADAASARLGES